MKVSFVFHALLAWWAFTLGSHRCADCTDPAPKYFTVEKGEGKYHHASASSCCVAMVLH